MTFFLSNGALSLALALVASVFGSVASQHMPYEPYDNGGKLTLMVGYTDNVGYANIVRYTNKLKANGKNVQERNVPFKRAHKIKGMDTTGYSVIEIESDDISAEIGELEAVKGVTIVEQDSEVHIMSTEYQQQLRGGEGASASDHVREIQDAIKATADQLREHEAEEGSNHGRRLAEETPYGITMVKSAYVHDQTQTPPAGTPPIKICVVDTGYGLGHPDLPNSSHNVTGYSPYGGTELWNVDGHGHGTHCAGTIGAIGGNNEGVTSVNPDPSKFKFFIGKGLKDSGSGYTDDVMSAVQECVNNGAKVISMSLGGGGYSSIYDAKYKEHYDDGVLIIAAAGNSGNSAFSYPASYPTVVSVASVTSEETHSSFSQYNDQVEIAGPGSGVKSTVTTNSGTNFDYATWSGTSMATPHVAGVAALLWYHFPGCTNNQIRNAMLRSARDKGSSGWDNKYGWGIVDAEAAYDLLFSTGCEGAGGPSSPSAGALLGGKDQLLSGNFPTAAPTPAPTFSPCPADQKRITVEILTDDYPQETSWSVNGCGTGGEVMSGGSYTSSGTLYKDSTCVDDGLFDFTINDAYGDGICCSFGGGSYYVKFDSEPVASGGAFGSEETTVFGSAPSSCGEITDRNCCLGADGCDWSGNSKRGSCESVAPSPSPPSPTPPSSCSSSACNLCSGGGECRNAGCTWSQGSCS